MEVDAPIINNEDQAQKEGKIEEDRGIVGDEASAERHESNNEEERNKNKIDVNMQSESDDEDITPGQEVTLTKKRKKKTYQSLLRKSGRTTKGKKTS